VARCTVERLMQAMGIKGVVRGRKIVITNPDAARPCPDDKVNRLFKVERPNRLWVSDFTYVPAWSGTVYVAFVIDVFARRPPGLATLETAHRAVSSGQARTTPQASAAASPPRCRCCSFSMRWTGRSSRETRTGTET
jgi:transposase InsO family protein